MESDGPELDPSPTPPEEPSIKPVDRGRLVLLMARRPDPATTKTRLAPQFGPQGAADLYQCFLSDTLDLLRGCSDCTPMVAADSEAGVSWFAEFAPDVALVVQVGPTLGHRLAYLLQSGLDAGYDSVFALASDNPDLPSSHLTTSFELLDQRDVDVVLGPTLDGGYYLIGWKQPWPALVTEVTMSTSTVVDDTLAIAGQIGARVALGPEWADVDEPTDVDQLRARLTKNQSSELVAPVPVAPMTTTFLADHQGIAGDQSEPCER